MKNIKNYDQFTEEVKKEVSAEATETKVAEVVEDTQSKTVTIAKAKGDSAKVVMESGCETCKTCGRSACHIA